MKSSSLRYSEIAFGSLLLILALFVHMHSGFADSIETGQTNEVILKVSLTSASDIDEGLRPFQFENNILASCIIRNPTENIANLILPEGTLKFNLFDYSVSNVTVFDNLGNVLQATVQNNTISNQYAEVKVPPNFTYKATLSFLTAYGVFYDAEQEDYAFRFSGNFSVPTSLTLILPRNYTLIPVYLGEPTIEEDNEFIILEWSSSTQVDYGARFLPFSVGGILKSYKIKADFSSVFPNQGQMKANIESAMVYPARIGNWKIEPLLRLGIPFPTKQSTHSISVEEVWDGVTSCSEVLEPIQNLDNSSRGHYFVDYSEQEVVVYPHFVYGDDFYQYIVSVTFVLPSYLVTEQQVLPYRYMSFCGIDVSTTITADSLKINLTGSLEVKFILPNNSELMAFESGNPSIGLEGNRPTASFVYNSPITFPSRSWTIYYEIVPLRNYFVIVVFSLLFIGIFIVLLKFLKIGSKAFIGILTAGISPFMVWNIGVFLTLGGFELTLTALFIFSLLFWILAFVAVGRKVMQEDTKRRRKERRNHEKTKGL